MTGIFAYGIFNPMGPTISIVSLLRHKVADKSLIHFMILNPFAQESFAIGVMPVDPDQKQMMAVIPESFAINRFSDLTLVSDLPTLLIHGGTKDFIDLGIECLSRHVSANDRTGEVAEQMSVLKKFEGRPWDRASHDMDHALDAILAKVTGKANQHPRPSDPAESEIATKTWLNYLISTSHLKPELAGFLKAWEGSIGIQNGNHPAQSAMPLKQMLVYTALSNPEFMIQMRSSIH